MEEKLRILVIGGHPADVFDHCGGTLCHHIRNGDQVTCLALTQGLRIHDIVISEIFRFGTEGYTQEQIDQIMKDREDAKYQEVRDACAVFGITDVRFLSYDDKMLQVTMPMIDAVAKVIREVRPDLLITHFPQCNGNVTNHHGNAAKIALDGAALAGTVDFDDPNPAWRIPQMAYMIGPSDAMAFDALSTQSLAYATLHVDVSDVAELKVKALDKMKSQQYQGLYARKSVETWNGVYGMYVGTSYTEAFVMHKPDVTHLIPVSQYHRMRANEPELNHRDRDCQMNACFVPLED